MSRRRSRQAKPDPKQSQQIIIKKPIQESVEKGQSGKDSTSTKRKQVYEVGESDTKPQKPPPEE